MSRLSDRGDVARILNVSHIIWTHVLPWCCPTLSNKGPTEKFRLRELHAVAAAGDAFFPLGTKVVNTFFRRYRDISMIVHEACAVRAEKIALAVVCRGSSIFSPASFSEYLLTRFSLGVKELSDRKAELSFSNSPEMISARQKLFATRATMLLNAYCSACEFGSAEFYESMRSMMRSTESKDIVVDCAIWPNYMLWQNSMDVACRGDNAKVARRLLAEPIPRQEVRSFLRRG